MTATRKKSGVPSRGRPPKSAATPDLREKILDAAEDLFARHGFYGVTTRQVAREAGVDVALTHYYFGTKRGLFDAVFHRRAEILNADRMALLNAYEVSHGGVMTAEGAIGAFMEPLFVRSLSADHGWKSYFALVAQVNNTPHWGGETMTRFFDPVVQRLIELLGKALPQAEPRDLYWGYQFLTGAMMLAFSETGRIDLLSRGLCRSSDLEAVRARLVAFCAAGICDIVERRTPTPSNDAGA